jgi:hypothetical protein
MPPKGAQGLIHKPDPRKPLFNRGLPETQQLPTLALVLLGFAFSLVLFGDHVDPAQPNLREV